MAITLQSLYVVLGLDSKAFEEKIGQATQQLLAFAGASGRVSQALIGLIGIEGAVGAAAIAAGVAAVAAAAAEEAELAKLNAVLQATGRLTEETSQSFINLARSQSEATTFSVNQTLSLERLAVTFGLTNKEIERAVPIIQSFSLATGRDSTEALRALGQAASGSTFALRRLGPEFKSIKDSTDPLNDTLRTMQRLSEGVAEAQAKTLTGAIGLLKNSLSNLLSAVGKPFLEWLTSVIASLAFMINKIAEAITWLDNLYASIPRVIRNLIGFGDAAEVSSETLDVFQKRIRETAVAAESFDEVLNRINARMKLLSATAQADIFGRTVKALSAPGLGDSDIKGILARQESELKASNIRVAREKAITLEGIYAKDIAMLQNNIAVEEHLRTIGTNNSVALAEELHAKNVELQDKLNKKISVEAIEARKEYNKQVEALEADSAKELGRIQTEGRKQGIQDQLTVTRTGLELEKKLRQDEAETETKIAESALDVFKSNESKRLAALRTTLDNLNAAEQAALEARGAMADAQTQIDNAKFMKRVDEQNRLRSLGFLDEQAAARENAATQNKIALDSLKSNIDLTKQRLAQQQAATLREIDFARQSADSKMAQVDAEHKFKVEEIQSTAELKKADLDSTIEIAKAEREAKVAEKKLEFDAFVAEKTAEANVLTNDQNPKVQAAGQKLLDALSAQRDNFAAFQDAQNKVEVMQYEAAQKQKTNIDRRTNAELSVEEAKHAADVGDIQNNLQRELGRLRAEGTKDEAEALRGLAGLSVKTAEDRRKAQERLAQAFPFLTFEQRESMLKGFDNITSQIGDATDELGKHLKATQDVGKATESIAGTWKVIFDTVDGVQKLMTGATKAPPGAAAAGATAGAGIGTVGLLGGNVSNTANFNVNGAKISLSVDEQATLMRIMSMLLGPDGNRVLEQYLKSTQGGISDRSTSAPPS